MTMQVPAPTAPSMVEAAPDLTIRRGGGVEDTRPLISYTEVKEMQASGQGVRLRQYGVVMRGPGKAGAGAGAVIAMPAEKLQKWIGQGYRPTQGVSDHDLYEYPAAPPPIRWLPSMIEEAIDAGEKIPEDLAPAGYSGPTFKVERNVAPAQEAPPVLNEACDICGTPWKNSVALATHKRMSRDEEHVAAREAAAEASEE